MISLENVSFRYKRSGAYVLKDVGVTLEPGHIYGLLGKNGVGKSTLFRLIMGLNRIGEGTIRVCGKDPWLHAPSMLREIFLLPEEVEFPRLSPLEYAHIYGAFYPNFSEEYLKSILDELKVEPEQKMATMSQGQRKKAYIAFALSCNTPILLMDEPTNGLDIPSKTNLRNILGRHASEERLIVISTHQVRDLECLINAVMILDESALALCTTAKSLFDRIHFGPVAEGEKVIYAEDTVAGRIGLKLRDPESEPQTIKDLNLETLFNAVMNDRESICKVLGE